MALDFGLTSQQRMIVQHARSRGLAGAQHGQIIPPMWCIALLTLLPLLMVTLPGRTLALLVVPLLGLWQRRRTEARIADWANVLLE